MNNKKSITDKAVPNEKNKNQSQEVIKQSHCTGSDLFCRKRLNPGEPGQTDTKIYQTQWEIREQKRSNKPKKKYQHYFFSSKKFIGKLSPCKIWEGDNIVKWLLPVSTNIDC